MDSYQSSDLVEHFRLDTIVTAECTTHIEYKTDRARGIRKEKVERRWHRAQCIGRGTFGVVWLEVREENDGVEKRAVKVIDKGGMQHLRVDYRKELLALSKFSKLQYEEVLVKFFGWFEDSSNLFLSMEYFELGDLEQHSKESLTEDDVKDITTDVLNGLRIMHSENFAHRDLKPSNIFVVQKPPASNWWVKIGDFGISKRVQGDLTALRTQVGTLNYEAPEIKGYIDTDEPTSVYDNAVDMWSMGCVIYKIATQNVPFPTHGAVFKFCCGILPFPEQLLLAKMSTDGTEFVKSLIAPNPRDRLSAASALEALWLSQRKRNTILKTEESSEHHVSTIARTATFKFGSPNEMEMSPHAKEKATGVTYSHKGLIGVADGVPKENRDKGMSLFQTSDNETRKLELVQSTTSSLSDSKLVSGFRDQTVRPWDSTTGEARNTLKGHNGRVYSVAFSPDGNLVASGSKDHTVRLWGSTTGEARNTLKGHSNWVWGIAFSPDGNLVASGSGDHTVRLWDSATGEARNTLKGHSGAVSGIAFSPDGNLVASGSSDQTVRLWDSTTGEAHNTLKGHSDRVWGVAFSPDGNLVASGSSDGTVRLWDSATGEARNTLKGHSDWVWGVAFSPDGKLVASGSGDQTVGLWDSATGEARNTLKGHSGDVYGVAFSPDGNLVASGSDDGTVRLWDSTTGEVCNTLKGHSSGVWGVAFSPDGNLVASGSNDRTVKLWDSIRGS
ncbi:MAG: hypothetical protein M1813_007390 [Trichoglossum hirsutum]|nr:MAG: hypothetical protein M1813_007390 [Trichoglossum hirsutum]